MLLDRIAEDLDETPEIVLIVLHELHDDNFIDFIYSDGYITATYKDEIFLQQYSVYQAIRRLR
jgi:hypothetical protein